MDRRIEFEKITRTIKSDELLHVFDKYKTLLILCLKAKEHALADKTGKYLIDIALDIVGKKKQKRENSIKEYFDTVQKDLEDNVILNLVAKFEKLVFTILPTAINNSKIILNSHYIGHEPFASSIKSFVKNTQDINNISGILNILSGSISVTTENRLKEIVDYRHRIAHGKRFGKESQLTVLEVLETLDETLELVFSKESTTKR